MAPPPSSGSFFSNRQTLHSPLHHPTSSPSPGGGGGNEGQGGAGALRNGAAAARERTASSGSAGVAGGGGTSGSAGLGIGGGLSKVNSGIGGGSGGADTGTGAQTSIAALNANSTGSAPHKPKHSLSLSLSSNSTPANASPATGAAHPGTTTWSSLLSPSLGGGSGGAAGARPSSPGSFHAPGTPGVPPTPSSLVSPSAISNTGGFSSVNLGAALPVSTPRDGHLHPLRYTWTFFFLHRPPGQKMGSEKYEEGMKKVASFSSIESFWPIYAHLRPPSTLRHISDYHLFKAGVRPVWEDEANAKGGKWIVRLKKGVSDRLWEDLILALIGDQFEPSHDLTGAVLSVRASEDILSLWNRDESDGRVTLKIRDTLRRVLNLPPSTVMEYKSNTESITDKSSFRNAHVDR